MGQYYSPVCLDRMEYLSTHDYDNGLKLMEHSYVGNNFMNAVCGLLLPGQPWYRTRIVWAGDYANPEPPGAQTLYAMMKKYGTKIHPPDSSLPEQYHYLVNYSNCQVIDLSTLKGDKDGWIIHPLSLLTAEGNGRGGGDFCGEDERVGCWARDELSIEDHVPEGFTVLDGQFAEE